MRKMRIRFLFLIPLLSHGSLSWPQEELGVIDGAVSGHFHRKIQPSKDVDLSKMLARFDRKPVSFAIKTRLLKEETAYTLYEVRFPSPYKSPDAQNNVVWCEYYRSKKEGKIPGIIALHILDGKFLESRIMCDYLARIGCHGLMLKMAYYGERRPSGTTSKTMISSDPNTMMAGIYQTVLDVRRAAMFLAAQEEVDSDRIGICGISLGAFVTALAIGVDGGFSRSAMLLGAGDFAGMVMHGPKEIQAIAQQLKAAGTTYESLSERFQFISPMTYAHRIPPNSLLMINGTRDEVVPPDNARTFWNATRGQQEILWVECSHYSAVTHLVEFMETVGKHFTQDTWK